MYYVKHGKHQYFVARGPKFSEGAFVGSLPNLGLLYYDYDDLNHWDDDYLISEYEIVSDRNVDGYDPAAMVAARGEMDRRQGEMAPPWFDDIEDLIRDLNLAVEQEDDDAYYEDDEYYAEDPFDGEYDYINSHDEDWEEIAESGERFLSEKGFDLNSLAGLKKAQGWLEKAEIEDLLRPEELADNNTDPLVGADRLAVMLMIVKARIDKKMKM